MAEEVDRMSDTVNNLLEAARLNSGRAKWNWAEVDLAEVADDAVASVRPLVDEARVQILVRTDPPDCRLLGDADAIRRLLVNLLSNARKHTAAGRIEVGAGGTPTPGAPPGSTWRSPTPGAASGRR
jgi:signal transduction histidine kinase